ncbi:MAG: serine/threonine protein kinase [Planctomycetes bacterium]|nr:serine/threonine protein kinase [Planctomycetota bacterium]
MSDTRDTRATSVANRLLQQLLRDQEHNVERSLADYQRQFPSHPEVIAREFAAITRNETAAVDDGVRPGPFIYPGQGDRYRRTATIGRGGMGTVFRVFDPALEREVAMKCLGTDDDKVPDAHMLRRFLDEAKVTGRLQHPGIVSVHEIGLDADRRPYFTMPLIEGRSLQELITAVHEGEGTWTQLRLLDVLVRVAETIAYAHERGVIHRDLKPANVLVGRFGETFVVDWGLARSIDVDHRRREPTDHGLDDGLGDGLDEGVGLRTMTGDVIGTPAYMAPEQARGDIDLVDQRSDVYSIGAMLYHLLAGTAPYGRSGIASTGRETLDRLLQAPPPRLPILRPQTAPELVAICERAMARCPDDRYASAAALGADLRAFLENRVVRAYGSGPLAELAKWVRRNRALAAACLVALLALIGGYVWSEIQRAAATANARLAADNGELAEENLELAFTAGDELLGRVGLYGIEHEPGADPLRETLLREALAYFERLRDLRGDDPRIEHQVAKALFRIALLETQLGRGAEAETAWIAARAATEKLIARAGETEELARQLLRIDLEQNIRLLQTGNAKASIPGLERVAAAFAAQMPPHPDAARLRDICTVTSNLALAMVATRNKTGALRYTDESLDAARALCDAQPGVAAARAQLGSALMMRGKLLCEIGELDEAEARFTEGTAALAQALSEFPTHRGIRFRLGETLNLHAVLLRQRNDLAGAAAELRRATEVFRQLTLTNPGVRNYHGQLGGALCNLGMMSAMRDDRAAAMPIYEEALIEIRRALEIDPTASDYRDYRRILGKEIAIAHVLEGRHVEAAAALRTLLTEQPEGSQWTCGRLFAVCAKASMFDDGLSAEDKARLAAGYGDEAVAALRRAAAAGTIDAKGLDSTAFDAIRERDDFRELLAGLRR